jgi:sugar phosphate isomerase/epimerase
MHELGLRINGAQLDNNPEAFIRNLDLAKETGFTAIEICPEDFDAIRCGELELDIVESLKEILSRYQFKISTHVPLPLNLFNRDEQSIHKRVLEASMEFTFLIGGKLMVYHPGRYVDNIEFSRYGKPDLSSTEKKKLRKKEAIFIQNLADRYPDIMIAMENQRPYLDYSPYCYAEFLDKLYDQVDSINKKNVGMMIDTGHMLLSSKYFDYDFMEEIHDCGIKPVHFHVNDNHGITTFYTEKDKKSQHPFGRGDEHIVPGTGIFPFRDFFRQFPDYEGSYVIELTNRFFYPAKIKESFDNLKSFLEND